MTRPPSARTYLDCPEREAAREGRFEGLNLSVAGSFPQGIAPLKTG